MTAPSGHSSPLLHEKWRYVERDSLERFSAVDWSLLNSQRGVYMREQQARQALDMLEASRDAPTFGYRINNYRHSLQSATLALRDDCDEEAIVVALFHDLGFIVCPDSHGAFAAEFLHAYISPANEWMLRHHAVFQQFHIRDYPGLDPKARERWRGHPHFDWTARFVERYDQDAIRPELETAPIETFEPLVFRLFAREPRPLNAG
jgi:predicted HD phosphohydrolase